MKASIWLAAMALALPAAACGDDDNTGTPPDARPVVDSGPVPDSGTDPDGMTDPPGAGYAFDDASYAGQIARQVEMEEIANYLNDAYTTAIKGGTVPGTTDTATTVTEVLNEKYYDWQGTDVAITITTTPPVAQTLLGDITAGEVKNLKEKIAGNDVTYGDVIGWSEGQQTGMDQTPDQLVQYWFGQLDALAADWQSNMCADCPTDPFGEPIGPAWITEAGQDLRQLAAKFLIGAVATSQATGDYLATILMEDNADGSYTTMEHHWDEAFGYFGAARDYGAYELAEIEEPGYADSNGDNAIDLLSEYNFDLARYAAERDLGSADTAKTNFAETLFGAFVEGRRIITDATADGDGALTDPEITALTEQRDLIVATWEKVLAANVIHYINETVADMEGCDEVGEANTCKDNYVFADVAEHWSEMKGFALALQFVPNAEISEELAGIHETYLLEAPVLPVVAEQTTDVVTNTGDIGTYVGGLVTARDMIGTIYGFDQANVEGW